MSPSYSKKDFANDLAIRPKDRYSLYRCRPSRNSSSRHGRPRTQYHARRFTGRTLGRTTDRHFPSGVFVFKEGGDDC
jgi:hypothetical protein